MMESWLAWARGPCFWFACTFLVLGLLRHVALTAWEIHRAVRRAGDRSIPYGKLAVVTLKWLFPFDKMGDRWMYSAATFAFHVSILVAPIFLAGHIELWRRGLGISWPAIPNVLADVLTIMAILTAAILIIERVSAKDSRFLSRFQDYALPLLVAVPFASGFLVMHPAWNPFAFEATLLVHVMSANLLLVLIPTTKLSHCVLLPTTQLVSEVGWHFTPDAGSRVAAALGKEGEPI